MLLYNRRSFLILATALAGCGFEPVYDSQPIKGLVGQIQYETPSSRDTFALRDQLEKRLGSTQNAKYGLAYSISVGSKRAAVSFDGRAYRQQLTGAGKYSLRDLSNNQVVISGAVDAFVGYAPTSTTSSQAAARDARARLMIQIGDLIVEDIMFKSDSLTQ